MAEAENTDDRLRLLIERVERLEEEKRGISDDIKDVYSEAKSVGYPLTDVQESYGPAAFAAGPKRNGAQGGD